MTNEQQILNLIAQYTYYVDQAKFDKVGELFANGKIIAPGSNMEGKEGVAKQLVKKPSGIFGRNSKNSTYYD